MILFGSNCGKKYYVLIIINDNIIHSYAEPINNDVN